MQKTDDERMQRAWALVIEQFRADAEQMSRENHPGVCMFRLSREDDVTIEHNCELTFIDKDGPLWNDISKAIDGSLLREYDPSKHFVIGIDIPSIESCERIRRYRLFELNTDSTASASVDCSLSPRSEMPSRNS